MANQEVRINVRVSREFKDTVNQYMDENHISLTDVVVKGISELMNPPNEKEFAKTETLEMLVKSLALNVQTLNAQLQVLQEKLPA